VGLNDFEKRGVRTRKKGYATQEGRGRGRSRSYGPAMAPLEKEGNWGEKIMFQEKSNARKRVLEKGEVTKQQRLTCTRSWVGFRSNAPVFHALAKKGGTTALVSNKTKDDRELGKTAVLWFAK